MVRRIMIAALASAALALPGGAPAAAAKPNPAKAAAKAGKAAHKAAHKSARSDRRAAAGAISRANAGSLLRSRTVVEGPLAGLSVGSQVMFDGGVAGTVERIVPNRNGRVRNVLVRLNDGRIVPLAPGSLAFDGSAWTATTLRPNANRRR